MNSGVYSRSKGEIEKFVEHLPIHPYRYCMDAIIFTLLVEMIHYLNSKAR